MKKMNRILALSFVFAVGLALTVSGSALADQIALWHYNNQTTGITAQNPYSTGVGDQFPIANVGAGTQSNQGTMDWGYNSGNQPGGGVADFTIDPATGLADMRYRAVGQSVGEGLVWNVSTAGYENIQLQVSVFTSTALNSPFSFDYYNGSVWVESTTTSYNTANSMVKYTLSAGADANNLSNFKFRLLLDTGSDRTITYDWVEVAGTQAVPIPAAAWLLGSGLVGLVAIKQRKKK